MKEFLLLQILRPSLQRLGTALGAYLATTGIAQDTIGLITAGAVALGGVLVDLLVRKTF